jgi:hypothetical protein
MRHIGIAVDDALHATYEEEARRRSKIQKRKVSLAEVVREVLEKAGRKFPAPPNP